MYHQVVFGLLIAVGAMGQSLSDLSFLQGSWAGKTEKGAYVEEYWSAANGDSMIGHCRFVKDGKTTFYELMSIVDTGDGIALRMRHFDGALVGWREEDEAGDCVLVKCENREAVFDNQKKEHHVRVLYKQTDPKTLLVTVEDTTKGETKSYPFEYKRVVPGRAPALPGE